jgi:hypothetical protein
MLVLTIEVAGAGASCFRLLLHFVCLQEKDMNREACVQMHLPESLDRGVCTRQLKDVGETGPVQDEAS